MVYILRILRNWIEMVDKESDGLDTETSLFGRESDINLQHDAKPTCLTHIMATALEL